MQPCLAFRNHACQSNDHLVVAKVLDNDRAIGKSAAQGQAPLGICAFVYGLRWSIHAPSLGHCGIEVRWESPTAPELLFLACYSTFAPDIAVVIALHGCAVIAMPSR